MWVSNQMITDPLINLITIFSESPKLYLFVLLIFKLRFDWNWSLLNWKQHDSTLALMCLDILRLSICSPGAQCHVCTTLSRGKNLLNQRGLSLVRKQIDVIHNPVCRDIFIILLFIVNQVHTPVMLICWELVNFKEPGRQIIIRWVEGSTYTTCFVSLHHRE